MHCVVLYFFIACVYGGVGQLNRQHPRYHIGGNSDTFLLHSPVGWKLHKRHSLRPMPQDVGHNLWRCRSDCRVHEEKHLLMRTALVASTVLRACRCFRLEDYFVNCFLHANEWSNESPFESRITEIQVDWDIHEARCERSRTNIRFRIFPARQSRSTHKRRHF